MQVIVDVLLPQHPAEAATLRQLLAGLEKQPRAYYAYPTPPRLSASLRSAWHGTTAVPSADLGGLANMLAAASRRLQGQLSSLMRRASLSDLGRRVRLLKRVVEELERIQLCAERLSGVAGAAASNDALLDANAGRAASVQAAQIQQLNGASQAALGALAPLVAYKDLLPVSEAVGPKSKALVATLQRAVSDLQERSLAFAFARLLQAPMVSCVLQADSVVRSIASHASSGAAAAFLTQQAALLTWLVASWACTVALPLPLLHGGKLEASHEQAMVAQLHRMQALWAAQIVCTKAGSGSKPAADLLQEASGSEQLRGIRAHLFQQALQAHAAVVEQLQVLPLQSPGVPLPQLLPDAAALLRSAAEGALRLAGPALASHSHVAALWAALLLCPSSPDLPPGTRVGLAGQAWGQPPPACLMPGAQLSPLDVRIMAEPTGELGLLLTVSAEAGAAAPVPVPEGQACRAVQLIALIACPASGQPSASMQQRAQEYRNTLHKALGTSSAVDLRIIPVPVPPTQGSLPGHVEACSLVTMLKGQRWEAPADSTRVQYAQEVQELLWQAGRLLQPLAMQLNSTAPGSTATALLQRVVAALSQDGALMPPAAALAVASLKDLGQAIDAELAAELSSFASGSLQQRAVRRQLLLKARKGEGSGSFSHAADMANQRLADCAAADALFGAAHQTGLRLNRAIKALEAFAAKKAGAAAAGGNLEAVYRVYEATMGLTQLLVDIHVSLFGRAVSVAADGQVAVLGSIGDARLRAWEQRLLGLAGDMGMPQAELKKHGVTGVFGALGPLQKAAAAGPPEAGTAPIQPGAEPDDPRALSQRVRRAKVDEAIQALQGQLQRARAMQPAPNLIVARIMEMIAKLQVRRLKRRASAVDTRAAFAWLKCTLV